ncbi:hypothetical protein MN116_008740 [Schistosoma mekongi]|uniref:Rho GTPase-activating protein 21 n=1 Tax=Schistosoma mekongi TaxID=38744 RepID=A0AAE2D1M1_SCHME|nr:hypothetical protein MN116_008740 [Schistosoma mekongi]
MDIPVSIFIEKTPFGLGFTLKDEGKPYESSALVTKVAKGSSAEASGLSIGDRIVAINQKLVKSMTFLEVSNFLRSGSDRNIKLTLLPKPPSPNYPINTVLDLPTPKILTSSNITNSIQSTSLKDSNSSFLRTTDVNNKEDDKAVLSPYCPSVVSSSDETNQNQPKKPPTPIPRKSFDKELLDSDEIEILDSLLEPVLLQFQESNTYKFNNSSSNNLSSDNLQISSEARKENSYPSSSMQLVHPPLTDNDVTPTKNKSAAHNCDSRDKPGFDTVGIIRKHTMDPTSLLYDTGTDSLPVRFIRKRAYASARHPGRYDQVKLLTSVNTISTTTITTSTATVTTNHTGSLTNTSPCQLLPALNVSHKHPISNNIIEPKVIHLPRRRSSGGQTPRSKNSKDKFYLHGVDNNDVFDEQSSQADIEIGKSISNVHHFNIPHSSSKEDSSVHCHGAYQDQSNYSTAPHATSNNKTSLLSSRLWASFDQDHNESVSELWTRAGEVYHMLELESQRLANRQIAVATTNRYRHHPRTCANNYQPMTNCFSVLSDNNPSKDVEFSSQLPSYSSPVVTSCHKDRLCTKVGQYSSHCAESTRDVTATNNPTTKRLQFRSLCSGLRPHRSESNILYDMSGSFLSRQCFCKILAIGGSDNKSYSWKPYYMCVSGTEVKFIKASSAYYGTGRTNKTSKHANEIIFPRNTSSSIKTLNTCKSHDELTNDDFTSYYYPSNNSETTDSTVNSLNVDKLCISSLTAASYNGSCIVLPIPGLIWRSEQLPTTFPNWLPLGISSSNITNQTTNSRTFGGGSSCNSNNNGIHPDWMDPHYSGLSQPSQQILSDLNNYQSNTTNPQNYHNTENEDCRSKFRCYRFAHIVVGVELLFVFPDENAAMTCLKMCQLSGGRDYDCVERLERCPRQNDTTLTSCRKKSSSNPYEVVLLKLSTTHHKLSLSEISIKSNQMNRHSFSLEENNRRVPLANDDDVEDGHGGDSVADNIQHAPHSIDRNVFVQPSSIFSAYSSPYGLLKDRRHRRYVINQSLVNSDISVDCENMMSAKNSVNKINKSVDAKKFWSRTQDKGDLDGTLPDNTALMTTGSFGNQSQTPDVIPIASNDNSNNVDDKSHPVNSVRTNKILRGFKQWLHRPVGGVHNHFTTTAITTTITSSISSNTSNSISCPAVGSMQVPTVTNNMTHVVMSNVTTISTTGSANINARSLMGHQNVNNCNSWEFSTANDASHSESPNSDHKVGSLTVDLPPNMTDLDTPGPIFGAPLESQLESPDYPCVPILLQAIVIALEIHGLTLPGLYRKPGRHRTIAQFVSSSNSHPEDVHMILSLDAWREPNALCGIFKHFLRRLPTGIFSLSSWEPLFCLVPEITNPSDTKQLAYLLLSIRVQLKKIAFDAFNITTLNAMPIDVQYNPSSPNDPSIEYHPFQFTALNFTGSNGSDVVKSSISSPMSPQISHVQSKEVNKSKKERSMVSKHSFCVWRWATLCYIINHITRVVSYEHRNSVSYQCIAICFGPVFFGNSSRLSKLNEVLEHLFRHWNWLIDGLPLITHETIQHINLNTFSYNAIMNEPTLQDAVHYLSTKSKYSHKKPILHDSSNNSCTQQPELINDAFCVQDKLTDVIFVQQSSDQEQLKSHPNLNLERLDNEDELNKEVIKNVQSLWLRALDKAKNQPHKHPNQIKEKSSSHAKLGHSKTLYHTASTVPKKTTKTMNGRKGGRRLTVDVLNPSPSPSPYDYYCISPPHLLSTKDKDDIIRLTNIKDISSRSTSRHPPTSQCDVVVRRPVIPVTTHTTSTIS